MKESKWPWPLRYQVNEELSLIGNSRAGQGTSFLCKELGFCFDVAFGLPYLLAANHFFISHAHMDHAGGIPYLISQKNLFGAKAAKFYVPAEMLKPLEAIIMTWSQMEGHEYAYELIGLNPLQSIELSSGWFMRCFRTNHRVPSLGYTLFKKRKKLNPQFEGLPREKLIELRDQGTKIEMITEEPWLTFTGDTTIEFLDAADWVRRSRYLMMEVTYIDQKRPVEKAREWGHIHLEELLTELPRIESEKIILIHLSARHKASELNKILASRLPENWQGRIDSIS